MTSEQFIITTLQETVDRLRDDLDALLATNAYWVEKWDSERKLADRLAGVLEVVSPSHPSLLLYKNARITPDESSVIPITVR